MIINVPTPIVLFQFQVEHYAELLANAKTIEQRIFRRGELHRLKEQLKTYLN